MELKPCPFCGNTPSGVVEGLGEYWVSCDSCLTSFEMKRGKLSAVEAWNRRANPDLRKLVEKLTKEAENDDGGPFNHGYRTGIKEAIIAINEFIRKMR